MISRAANFLARNGSISPQDRWEENAGNSPFTLGIEISALVAAADYLPAVDRAYALFFRGAVRLIRTGIMWYLPRLRDQRTNAICR